MHKNARENSDESLSFIFCFFAIFAISTSFFANRFVGALKVKFHSNNPWFHMTGRHQCEETEHNFVADAFNWEQRVKGEVAAARAWSGNWGEVFAPDSP